MGVTQMDAYLRKVYRSVTSGDEYDVDLGDQPDDQDDEFTGRYCLHVQRDDAEGEEGLLELEDLDLAERLVEEIRAGRALPATFR